MSNIKEVTIKTDITSCKTCYFAIYEHDPYGSIYYCKHPLVDGMLLSYSDYHAEKRSDRCPYNK